MRLSAILWSVFVCAFIGWWSLVIIVGGAALVVLAMVAIDRYKRRNYNPYDEYPFNRHYRFKNEPDDKRYQ